MYVISILENYSRALLASALSPTQDLVAVLIVVFDALRKCGSPEAIVSDGGAVFRAKRLLNAYAALGIRREQIPPGQPWTNYIEAHFGIMRRLADAAFARATTWEEMIDIHAQFVLDYNTQVHWAHRDRQDEKHSPAQVFGWVKGTMYPEPVLHRALYALQFMRRVDDYGYVRLYHWRFYGELGLAGKLVAAWLYEGTLRIEYETVLLARYEITHERDGKHIREVSNPRIATTRYRSPQLALFELGPDDWLPYIQVPHNALKRRQVRGAVQLSLALEAIAA